MRPFQTGTPRVLREVFDYLLAESAELDAVEHAAEGRAPCLRRLPCGRAGCRSCRGTRDVPPSSIAATVKAQRVRVEGFSKMSATFLRSSRLPFMPARFLFLRSAARSRRYSISAGVWCFREIRWRFAKIHRHLDCSLHEFCIGLWFLLRLLIFSAFSGRGPRFSGIDMQRGPPRPRPSSGPSSSSTSTPLSRSSFEAFLLRL